MPVHVANKIAAGEVVDRPASVLKELVENSIDSGASQIHVEISTGGRKLVAVSDNGSGMNRDDAILSIERHATSKISDVDDIEKIHTLGFRGEALAAIASVSRFHMKTCCAGETTGTEIIVTGGKLADVRDIGCPPGTSIEVRDIFFNVPARRKFLRGEQTELSNIRAGFIVQALSHPMVGISLKVDGRETYRLAPGADLENRLRNLFGSEFQKSLRKVEYHSAETTVRGYVTLPAASRADRNEQYFFINGRVAGAPLFSYALREGYRTLLPADRHPSVFLLLEMDPGLVDVNVHPTKKEVRFRHPDDVRDVIITGVREALKSETTGVTAGTASKYEKKQETPAVADIQLKIDNLPPTRTFRYPRMPVMGNAEKTVSAQTGKVASSGQNTEEKKILANAPWSWCRVLGQIGSLYVVLETEDGFVVMDPHAAHERVLFERFMSDVLKGKVQTQSLLLPETVELMPDDALRVRKNLDLFKKMGFGISEFGGDSFVVDALPSYFSYASARILLIEIAHSLEQSGKRGGNEKWREESIAQAACKSAVKMRDKLNLEEIEKLVVDLAQTEMPYTCPHGRPTLIFTSFRDLNRKFGRE
ncbi:MAG: DNA mismatch repair endonuclease MutL [Kiritimatiellae bacterium]|nr:DNA mismatch repair endonuclease MutL [Kiritimatiellia bacterium]MDD5522582.1 DNA mismatch repair endonuclease MutL [Kiritimatiellia bacterium]